MWWKNWHTQWKSILVEAQQAVQDPEQAGTPLKQPKLSYTAKDKYTELKKSELEENNIFMTKKMII